MELGGRVAEASFLAGSEYRVEIIRSLAEREALSKRELRETCGGSTVTVTRNLEKLIERGYVEESGTTYRLTAAGELLAEELFDLLECAGLVRELRPFLQWIPESALGVDLTEFSGATVVVSSEEDPYAPMKEYAMTLTACERARQLLPAVTPETLRAVRDGVSDRNASHDIVIEDDALATIRSDRQYRSLFEEVRSRECVSARVYAGEVPYLLGVVDEEVRICGYDDRGMPRALLKTAAGGVREWARGVFQRHRAEAVPIEAYL